MAGISRETSKAKISGFENEQSETDLLRRTPSESIRILIIPERTVDEAA